VLVPNLAGRPLVSDLFGKRGRAWPSTLELPDDERLTVDASLVQIDFLSEEVGAVDRQLARSALGSPERRGMVRAPHRGAHLNGRQAARQAPSPRPALSLPVDPHQPEESHLERFIQTLLGEWAYERIYVSAAERTAALPLFLVLQLQATTRLSRTQAARITADQGDWVKTRRTSRPNSAARNLRSARSRARPAGVNSYQRPELSRPLRSSPSRSQR
jgi:hypothetical protein